MARRTKKQAKEGRPAARPPRRQAPLYDQASAPPPPRRPRQGQQGMQQVVLPLQGPPQPAPQRARRRGRPTPSGYRRRVTRGEMRRRRSIGWRRKTGNTARICGDWRQQWRRVGS